MTGIYSVQYEIGKNYEDLIYPFSLTLPYATGVSRRQIQNATKMLNIYKENEILDQIWDHHEECILKRTNMPGIG